MVEYNRHKKKELKHLNEQVTKQDGMVEHKPRTNTNNYVYIGGLSLFVFAIGRYVLFSKFKKPEQTPIDAPTPPVLKTSKNQKEIFLKCSKNFYCIIYKKLYENYMKDLKESVYHGAVVSALAIGYTMLGKTLVKMSPPSLSKFDVEDGVKLVAIVAISDFTKDYLIKQK